VPLTNRSGTAAARRAIENAIINDGSSDNDSLHINTHIFNILGLGKVLTNLQQVSDLKIFIQESFIGCQEAITEIHTKQRYTFFR
jgi:hypothetical protein